MKFIPILFSTPMVQAILEGYKTQTRRANNLSEVNHDSDEWKYTGFEFGLHHFEHSYSMGHHPQIQERKPKTKCPYGQVGDVLWVRETWIEAPELCTWKKYSYKADYNSHLAELGKWKPSIYMPKSACRIFLKVKSVRVERLQDISEQDAKSEGVLDMFFGKDIAGEAYFNYMDKNGGYDCVADNAIHSFQTLWQSINGPESWEANHWVWVIEFERVELTEEQKHKFLTN